jgi:hypothetical protein
MDTTEVVRFNLTRVHSIETLAPPDPDAGFLDKISKWVSEPGNALLVSSVVEIQPGQTFDFHAARDKSLHAPRLDLNVDAISEYEPYKIEEVVVLGPTIALSLKNITAEPYKLRR